MVSYSQCSKFSAAEDRAYVKAVWASYFDPAGDPGGEHHPLPDPGLDLSCFFRDIIPGKGEKTWPLRSRDITQHFRNLEPEFRGMPRITHLLTCSIVCLRRDKSDQAALKIFRRILAEAGPQVATLLNSRWLTSVCDTVVDTAENDVDRAMAFAGTIFVSTIKMAETELRLYFPQRPVPPKYRLRHGGEIYDGVQTIWTEGLGDIANILDRIDLALTIDSSVTPILTQLIGRAIDGNTFLNRIIGTAGTKRLPMAPAEQIKELHKIMRLL